MLFQELINKAKNVRKAFQRREKNNGTVWSKENIAEGFVVDVGDLMKLVMAKQGLRQIDDVDKKLSHELSDCLWSIIILAELYNIDLEKTFIDNMNQLEKQIKETHE